MDNDISKIINGIAEDFVEQMRMVMDSDIGINSKVGKNTLTNSNLYNQLEYNTIDTGKGTAINIMANFYIVYIEAGRPPRHKKAPPVNAIKDWLERKHIKPDNKNITTVEQLAFVISRAIWRDGYKPRKITPAFMEALDKRWDETTSMQLFDYFVHTIEETLDII